MAAPLRLLRTGRHELWWAAEQLAGRLWDAACHDGVSCALDWLPALCTRRRHAAHRALHPESFTPRECR